MTIKCLTLTLAVTFFVLPAHSVTIDLTMVGDTGFNKNNQGVRPTYVDAYGSQTSWADLTEDIEPYIDGDLNFLNLETVVTEESLSLSVPKSFKFQSHPNSVRHMIRNVGFNMMSLANNHSADYGRQGLVSTYEQMQLIAIESSVIAHGIGVLDELLRPRVFSIKGVDVAFLSIGIDQFGRINFPASETQIGSFTFRNTAWVNQAMENLKNSSAQLKIVSLHYGSEGQVYITNEVKRVFRQFVDIGDADVVIGHHPHVVRPIEIYNESLITYSLGNFLLIGAANMGRRGDLADYGLILKASLEVNRRGVSVNELKAIPIYDMHYKPYALDFDESRRRLGVMNHLNNESFSDPIQFRINNQGEGVWRR